MLVEMNEQSPELKILFSLLIGSGLLTREEFEEARLYSTENKIPITDAVMKSGLLSERNFALSMDLQKKVLGNQITSDLGIRALRMALQQNLSLEEAIYSVQSKHEKTSVVVSAANELTTLLLNARFISPEDLGRLIKLSNDSQMMIGHLLMLDSKISPEELLGALNLVISIREQGLDKNRAAQGLRYARQNGVLVEQALVDLGFFIKPRSNEMRLGELFIMANLVSIEDLCECMEIELFKMKKFGQIVIERGIVNSYQLESATKLQDEIKKKSLKPWQAAEALWKVCKQNEEFQLATAPYLVLPENDDSKRLSDLLIHAGLCPRGESQNVLVALDENSSSLKEAITLLNAALIDKQTMLSALRLHSLLIAGYIPRERALELIRTCSDRSISLDQALSSLALFKPARFQWQWYEDSLES